MTSTLYMTHDADLPSTAGHYASLIRQPTTVTSQEPVAGAPKAPQPPSGDLGRQAVMDVTASFHERFRDAIIAEAGADAAAIHRERQLDGRVGQDADR